MGRPILKFAVAALHIGSPIWKFLIVALPTGCRMYKFSIAALFTGIPILNSSIAALSMARPSLATEWFQKWVQHTSSSFSCTTSTLFPGYQVILEKLTYQTLSVGSLEVEAELKSIDES